jgi:hypothetical protein
LFIIRYWIGGSKIASPVVDIGWGDNGDIYGMGQVFSCI